MKALSFAILLMMLLFIFLNDRMNVVNEQLILSAFILIILMLLKSLSKTSTYEK